MKLLDLGCGERKYPGAIGLDKNPLSDADILCDLDHLPYPLTSETFDLVMCDNVLEHLKEPLHAMEEIHRILKPGGVVKIISPHFSSDDSFTDITHRYHFSFRSFDLFTDDSPSSCRFYTRTKFKMLGKKIVFGSTRRYIGLEFLLNKFPSFYESHLAFIFQAHSIYFEMMAIK